MAISPSFVIEKFTRERLHGVNLISGDATNAIVPAKWNSENDKRPDGYKWMVGDLGVGTLAQLGQDIWYDCPSALWVDRASEEEWMRRSAKAHRSLIGYHVIDEFLLLLGYVKERAPQKSGSKRGEREDFDLWIQVWKPITGGPPFMKNLNRSAFVRVQHPAGDIGIVDSVLLEFECDDPFYYEPGYDNYRQRPYVNEYPITIGGRFLVAKERYFAEVAK